MTGLLPLPVRLDLDPITVHGKGRCSSRAGVHYLANRHAFANDGFAAATCTRSPSDPGRERPFEARIHLTLSVRYNTD